MTTISQEDVNLARGTAVLYDFPKLRKKTATPFRFERAVVPVYASKEQIGSAHLFFADNKIMCMISFTYACPERLDLQVDKTVWAFPEGTCYSRVDDGKVDYADITKVELSYYDRDEGPGVGSPVSLSNYDS